MLAARASTTLRDLRLGVELEVRGGSSLALAGPSGAGKTSVLRIVAGLLRPEAGHVTCAGERWLDTRRDLDLPPERRGCGFMFQGYALFPHLRAWENVAYGLRGSRRARREGGLGLVERVGGAGRGAAVGARQPDPRDRRARAVERARRLRRPDPDRHPRLRRGGAARRRGRGA